MLHKDVLMQDIDVAQWRNAQELLLESAKERRRIVVLHDAGTVRKVVHSQGETVRSRPGRVDDPTAIARALYEANSDSVDFVAVFERAAFDAYFAAVQDSWEIDEELDSFVQRTYALLDEFPAGMVTFPGKARSTLGLQWRLGASRDDVARAVANFAEGGSTVVFGVFDKGALWASLVLTFDEAGSIVSVTTADPSEVELAGDPAAVAAAVVEWVCAKHGPCSLGLFLEKAAAEILLAAEDKAAALRDASGNGTLILTPVPPAFATALA
ncbi:MAG: hypothetical protein ACRDNT_05020 [Streptosporangiaceae bacterium]